MQTIEYLMNNLSYQQWRMPTRIYIFCVGSHHQNTIVEIRTQTLTLGDRTLILHEKIYRTEAITTILWTYAMKVFV